MAEVIAVIDKSKADVKKKKQNIEKVIAMYKAKEIEELKKQVEELETLRKKEREEAFNNAK